MAVSSAPQHLARSSGVGPGAPGGGLVVVPGPVEPPGHAELAHDLRRLRERGLLKIRGLELPALDAVVRAHGGDRARPLPRVIEHLLGQACDRFGDDDLGSAARILFGLVQGSIGHSPTDLRERAAAIFNRSSETFRKDRERVIIDRLADELLALVDPPDAGPRSGPDGALDATAPAPPTGLPRQSSIFTGREQAIAELFAAVTSGPGREPRICAVHGMAGVGKTALVTRVATRLADRFRDGVLYVDLHGQSATRPAQDPAEVLDRLLRRLPVDPEQIPAHQDDRAALWSELVAQRHLLLVLDNARDADQVLPLLPAASRSSVIVTSRDRLAGLDEAWSLALDVLPRAESVALFTQVAGIEPGAAAEAVPAALDAVAARCGDLPLALRIAAARYRADPVPDLADLQRRLSGEHGRLAELDDGTRSVAVSFAVSSASLPTADRAAFRALGLHPGSGLSPATAAVLLDQPEHRARRALDLLLDRHLIERRDVDRYEFHDLVADFARRQAAEEIPAATAAAAFRRLAEHYLATVAAVDDLLTPHRFRIDLAVPALPADRRPADPVAARAWVRTEEDNLVAVCLAAGQQGLDVLCWQLAYVLRGWFFIGKSWAGWRRTHRAALAATRRLGDRRAEAMTLNNLGLAALEQDQLATASEHYAAALVLFRAVGDRHGEHNALVNQAWVTFAEHRYEEFLTTMRLARDFYAAEGSRRNAAITSSGMALGEVAAGRPGRAVRQLQQALQAFAELGLAFDTAMALNNLGEAHTGAGAGDQATRSHLDALATARTCGSPFEAARAQARLGDLAAARHDPDLARRYRTEALAGFEALDAPQAAPLRRLLGMDR